MIANEITDLDRQAFRQRAAIAAMQAYISTLTHHEFAETMEDLAKSRGISADAIIATMSAEMADAMTAKMFPASKE